MLEIFIWSLSPFVYFINRCGTVKRVNLGSIFILLKVCNSSINTVDSSPDKVRHFIHAVLAQQKSPIYWIYVLLCDFCKSYMEIVSLL